MRRERKVLFTFRISRLRWSGRKLRYDKSAQRVLSTPSPLRGTLYEPDVKLGSLTLTGHRMTSSHSSNGLIRPVSGGELVTIGTVFCVQFVFRHRTDDVLSKYPIAGSFGCL